MVLYRLHLEAFQIGAHAVVGILDDGSPGLVGLPLLDAEDVLLEVVVGIRRGDVEVAVVEHHEQAVVVLELSERRAVRVIVEAVDVSVPPYFASAQRGVSVALEGYLVYGHACQDVSLGSAAFDGVVGEVLVHEDVLQTRVWLECHLYHFRLAVGVGGEVYDAALRCAQREVVLLVAETTVDVEALDVVRASLSVAVDGVVCRAFVVAFPDADVHDVLAYVNLVRHLHHFVFAVAVEDDDIVDVGAVGYELRLLQSGADEAFLTVDVQFLVCLHHLCGVDGVEVTYLGESRVVFAVFLLEVCEPFARHLHHASEVAFYLVNLRLNLCHQFVCLVFGELEDALHLYLHESQYVLLAHFAHQLRVERGESFVDVLARCIHGCGVLVFAVLIDALLDENLLQ